MTMNKKIMMVLAAVLFNCMTGGLLAMAAGISPAIGAAGMNAVAVLFGGTVPQGVLRAGVYKEIWAGELVKALRGLLEGTWLDGIPDSSSLVNNDIIHLVEVGVDPEVLINNTTYPIPLQALDDADIAIELDKFQTKVTPITDDELYAISYDKMSRVKESHSNAINDAKFAKAAHALCPTENTDTTPVLVTTGERDAETGRLRLVPGDIVRLKAALDKLRVPADKRRLVLCSDHVNDLLMADQKFKEQYNLNQTEGRIGRLYGFDIYEFGNTPLYTVAGKKKAVGALAEAGEFQCSFAFYVPRVFKATGSTKMYYSEASTDPEYQRNKINFRHYFICMFKKADAGVAIRSGYQASSDGSITADPTTVTIPAEGGSKDVTVTASGAYTVGAAPEGFNVSKKGNTVTISAEANEGEQKSGTLTLTLQSNNSKTAKITITQPKQGA